MISSKPVNVTLATLAVIGVAATSAAGAFGLGLLPPNTASAAPPVIAPGTLGVADESFEPPVTITPADDKIEVASAAGPSALFTVASRKPAPVAVHRASARGVAAPTGWLSARCSWYGPRFYGRRTASGAVLSTTMMNVAHRSLPFGTRIQFSYKGRSCIAVVNDRGPYIGGRTFDLGPGTAKALGFSGVGAVSYRILGK